MIKKFNQFTEGYNTYDNVIINTHEEYYDLLKDRAITMDNKEFDEIKTHMDKYSTNFKIEISEIRMADVVGTGTQVKIFKSSLDFYIYKLTDDWFALSFIVMENRLWRFKDYKCDEMQGLLNQIDESIKKYL